MRVARIPRKPPNELPPRLFFRGSRESVRRSAALPLPDKLERANAPTLSSTISRDAGVARELARAPIFATSASRPPGSTCSSSRPTSPKPCNFAGAGASKPPIGLVARPASRSSEGRHRRRTPPGASLCIARSATVADGGPVRACIGNRCSPPSPSIGRARLVLPQETCPGLRCCIHERPATSQAAMVSGLASAPGRPPAKAAVPTSWLLGRQTSSLGQAASRDWRPGRRRPLRSGRSFGRWRRGRCPREPGR